MSFIKFSLFSLFFSLLISPAFAELSADDFSDADPANGNLIAEPVLADYVQADRSPGILVEAYDIVDSNGSF